MKMTKELYNILIKELSKIIYTCSINKHIKAIYLLEFEMSDENIQIEIVLLSDKKINIKENIKIKEYDNKNNKELEIRILTTVKNIEDYYINSDKCIDLYNGILVFDRDKIITKLKNRLVLLPVYSNIKYDLNNTVIYEGIKKYRKERAHIKSKLKVLN